jgi:hypothetical protein
VIQSKDISGFMLMRDEDGNINIQIIADHSVNMSVVSVEGFNIDIAAMLDSLCPALDVEGSLSDKAVESINSADELDKTLDSGETSYVGM